MNWREGVLRYIIVVTDTPAYPDKERTTYSISPHSTCVLLHLDGKTATS